MILIKADRLSQVYRKLYRKLRLTKTVTNTKELTNVCLQIRKPSLIDISFPFRKISKKYLDGELKWYWSADNRVDTISQYAKLWTYISDDGVTNNSAYGYIIHKKYNYDQLTAIIEELKSNKFSRRALLNISDPTLNKSATKDYQCTVAIQFLIRDEKVHMTVYMRSNDIRFGLPYDTIYFMSLQAFICQELKLSVGQYHHHATSMHMYLKDESAFKRHSQRLSVCLDDYSKYYTKEAK